MKDTINLITDKELISSIIELMKNNSNNGIDPIYNVIINAICMIAIALIAMLSQHWISRKTIRADFEKINMQIKSDFEKINSQLKADVGKIGLQVQSDFQMKMKFEWISNMRNIIADLITTTDPDYNRPIDRRKMLHLINQSQIMLDVNNNFEDKLACLITELGHVADYDKYDTIEERNIKILNVQDEITKLTRIILKEKQNEKIL